MEKLRGGDGVIIETERHPLVYADWLHAPGKPTVLCYGHFDVQPPDPLELWETPPFEPTERNGNLYARGSADDKGQMYSHIKAVERIAGGLREDAGESEVPASKARKRWAAFRWPNMWLRTPKN
jgi:acetylornithine deacetylase/succinyl-diaminopimelate desuccinylase-like protein